MSNPDSFLDEVAEEVRKDQLYALARRYGWIVGVVILLAVGGAAVNEYLKAQTKAEAQARGGAIEAALQLDTPEARADALAPLTQQEADAAIVALFLQVDATAEAGNVVEAEALLEPALTHSDPVLADLARLKLLGLMAERDAPATERLPIAEALIANQSAFTLLALEQRAIARVEQGDRDGAIADLSQIDASSEATETLRERAQMLLQALGADAPGQPRLVTGATE
ncbi:hypothetical protein FHS89_002532 [Rubricella aquisinus]|uniref:Tetratricopeptide repeat-like domain-containing protein n=1 Tax=Rubricella aquisinus TaxID=2028108 RepID=A0A840WPD3_9RHOB|nr:hypothetical protein [Rubricella aquisinus]MBB5516501.1 hypothetical protein [Rubricella aquisinus]